MRTVLQCWLIAVWLILAQSVAAATVTIDFEEQTVGPNGPFPVDGPDFGVVDGFHFYRPDSRTEGGWIDPMLLGMPGNDSSVALGWCGLYCSDTVPGTGTLVMEAASGGHFDLVGFDFSNLAGDVVPLMEVVGHQVGGGTLTALLFVPAASVWDTTVLNWTNLSHVEFVALTEVNVGFIDNVVVNTVVPIPAAVWLFGSGLGLLGWFRRKQA